MSDPAFLSTLPAALAHRIFEARKANFAQREKAAADATAEKLALKAIGVSELGVITLIAASEGNPGLLDLDEEFVDKAGLVKLAFDFCSDKGRTFKANHGDEIECELVQTWAGPVWINDNGSVRTLKAQEKITQDTDIVAVGIKKAGDDARDAWFVEVKPSDAELVELAKAGGIAGASWGAHVTKIEV